MIKTYLISVAIVAATFTIGGCVHWEHGLAAVYGLARLSFILAGLGWLGLFIICPWLFPVIIGASIVRPHLNRPKSH